MSKNLVLCCDGTANEFAQDRTNVVKLFSTLVNDTAQQVAYYHPGLGTMEPPGALTTPARWLTKLLGKAVGFGLEADIRDAYVFLMRNYKPGDKVYMFGFSRGAFTVRAVASLLRLYGLISSGNEPLVPYAIRMMSSMNRLLKKKEEGNPFALANEFIETFSTSQCKPWFVGVWDTVSSVGWLSNPLRVPCSANNPDIKIARHAVSIDERRSFFRQNLWKSDESPSHGDRDMKQVWFPGVHCDVGGGYPENESGLSKIALEWMIREAQAAGLLMDEQKIRRVLGQNTGAFVRPDPNAMMHKSLKVAWWFAEFIPKPHYNAKTKTEGRKMNLFRRRTIPPNSMVHESAFLRNGDYKKVLPSDAILVKTCVPSE